MPHYSTLKPGDFSLSWLGVTLLAVALLFGGASRPDVAAPILVRFSAILVLTALVARGELAVSRWSLGEKALWLLLLGVPLLQLVPLPWSVWTALPARAYPERLFEILGTEPFQPLTLVPDRTVNAFAALFPALAAFAVGRVLDDAALRRFWSALLLIAVVSGLLGIFQVLDGTGSALRFYAITNDDAAVGLFSNANHHALLLAMAMPAVALWVDTHREPNRRLPPLVTVSAAAALGVLLTASVLTLSRAGTAFAVLSLPLTAWLLGVGKISKIVTFRTLAWTVGGLALATVLVVGFRAALVSYFGVGESEGRLDNLPLLLAMIRDSFPFGTGMGSLDPVFRGYETVDRLKFGYLNNAHNDYLQLTIEAGVLAPIALALFFVLIVPRIATAYRSQARTTSVRPQTLCSHVIVLALVHSLVDYPLRTAAVSVVFALSCGVLLSYRPSQVAGSRRTDVTPGGSANA